MYYDPISPENRLEFYKIVEGFALAEKSTLRLNRELDVWGRKLAVPRSSQDGKVAIFTFRELCGNPLSAADYLEIVKQFEVVFIEDIPQLTLSQKDQVRPPRRCDHPGRIQTDRLQHPFCNPGSAVHSLHRRCVRVENEAPYPVLGPNNADL